MENMSLVENAATIAATRPTVKTVKEFVTENGFVEIAREVRANSNGYPFVTFINGQNIATNVYFSQNAAGTVEAGQPITRELIADLQIVFVKNADGEDRIKISRKSTSRLSLEDLF